MAKGQVVPVSKQMPVALMQRLKNLASKQAKGATAMASGSSFMSIKGGNIMLNGAAIPGNKVSIIVLAMMMDRAYYEDDYDSDARQAPTCYAYGEVDGDSPKAPHEKAADKQSGTCATCEFSKFGSAPRGRGQACREGVKLAFIPADTNPETLKDQPIYQVRVPPTSIKYVKGWLDQLGASGLHSSMVETEFSTVPDAKSIFTVHLRVERELTIQQLSAVSDNITLAADKLTEPYPDFEEEQSAPKKSAAKKTSRKY